MASRAVGLERPLLERHAAVGAGHGPRAGDLLEHLGHGPPHLRAQVEALRDDRVQAIGARRM
jgi:hypothetical protein